MHFAAAWNDMRSDEVAHLFLKEVFRGHGLLKYIVSDSGFISRQQSLPEFLNCLASLASSNLSPQLTILNLKGKVNAEIAH